MDEVTLVLTQDFALDAGAAAIAAVAATGPLWKASLVLSTNNGPYDSTMTKAKFDSGLPTYTAYALGLITWGPPTLTDDGKVEYIGTAPEFRPGDAAVANLIKGIGIENFANTKLYACAPLPAPGVPMSSVLTSLGITVRYRPQDESLALLIT